MLGYTITISLIDTHPIISRKIIISKSMTFKNLHDIIATLYGLEDTDRYLFHINEDIKLFEYSIAGYCYDDVYECKLSKYFNEKNIYGYEYNNKNNYLFKINVEDQIDDAPSYPVIKSVKGRYNPCKIEDLTTFNQVILYMKNKEKYPIELYENELKLIETIDKDILQKRLNKLFNVDNKTNDNVYVDSEYSLDKYFNNL